MLSESGMKTSFVVIFIINISIIIAIICGVVYGCNKIREKGLKGVAESVWNGPTNPAPVKAVVTNTSPE
jgi:hypothetical protein